MVDGNGNVYIADANNQRIRMVTAGGTITTFAGTGVSGFSGDGGPATLASLKNPATVSRVSTSSGNLYINDNNNFRIREVTTGGEIFTVAGNGTPGFSGDNSPAASAKISTGAAVKLAIDASGNLYIPDAYNNRIRKVAANGTITTIAGTGVGRSSGDGGAALAAELSQPEGVILDAAGDLFIARYLWWAHPEDWDQRYDQHRRRK